MENWAKWKRDNFPFGTHINSIANKGNKTLRFVRRNIRTGSIKAKATAYTSLVRPQLEYCSSVWDPHQSTLNTQLEAIQRRAARYSCHNYQQTASVSNMMKKLKWLSLVKRREMNKLIMMYKIVNSLVALNILHFANQSNRTTRSNKENNYIPIPTSTSYPKATYFPSTIPIWNSLPEHIKI